MRTGYLNRSRFSPTPLARAVVTYCLPSSSSIMARKVRIMPAVLAMPITSTSTANRGSMSMTLPQLQGAI